MRTTITTFTLAGVLALLLAGCGGGSKAKSSTTGSTTTASGPTGAVLSKAAYDAKMAVIGQSIGTSIATLATATTAKAAATGLIKVQASIRATDKKIEAINPPAPVKVPHAQLVKGVGELADQFGPIIKKLKGGNLDALSGVTTLPALAVIQKAAALIVKDGYNINGSSGTATTPATPTTTTTGG